MQRKYGCDFYEDFKRLGLTMRDNHEKSRLYTCDSDYFKNIDTEEKAYWFGFCYADGYITKNTGCNSLRFGLAISTADYEHQVKFKKAIQFTGNINKYIQDSAYKEKTEYCRIIITDETFVNNIMSHGLVCNKSNILEPPIGIPDELVKHFIRGFMDGNGSITITNNIKNHDIPSYGIEFISTDSVLNWIQKYLVDNGAIPHTYPLSKRKPEHIVSYIKFGGNRQVKTFLDYIYDGATVWLDRKYQRYLSLCELLDNIDANKRVNKCAYCGTTESSEFDMWKHGGEYDGKILCVKHYRQMLKYGRITPDKKDCCDICGSSHGGVHQIVSSQWGEELRGKTLCSRHHSQLRYYGKIVDIRSWEERHGVANDIQQLSQT